MRKWKRVGTAAGPRFRSALDPREAGVLINLIRSLLEMLDARDSSSPADELEQITGMRAGNSTRPADATLGRLLPDFHRPDGPNSSDSSGRADRSDSLNAALRSLHEPQIIDAKRRAAQRVLDTVPAGGGRFELTEGDANSWLASVNDVRLALGTMLGIGPDGPDRLPDDHPMVGHLDVYQWLTWLQESLVLALLDGAGR